MVPGLKAASLCLADICRYGNGGERPLLLGTSYRRRAQALSGLSVNCPQLQCEIRERSNAPRARQDVEKRELAGFCPSEER